MADKEVRLIDKDKLIEKINAEIDAWAKSRMCMTADELLETIEEFEEEAEPVKHGQFEAYSEKEKYEVYKKYHEHFDGVCSECGSNMFESDKFCAECGTRMDGDSE